MDVSGRWWTLPESGCGPGGRTFESCRARHCNASGVAERGHPAPVEALAVLLNLLSNEAKFTENGTIGLYIERRIERSREWIEFRVTDGHRDDLEAACLPLQSIHPDREDDTAGRLRPR